MSRAEDARQQPMDKVLFMIYGITWLIGVSLPLLVLCIYRTLQQIRCLPALKYFWPSAIVFGSLLFCVHLQITIFELSLKMQTQVLKRKSKSGAVSNSRYIIIMVVVSWTHALPVFTSLTTGPHPNQNNTPEIHSTR